MELTLHDYSRGVGMPHVLPGRGRSGFSIGAKLSAMEQDRSKPMGPSLASWFVCCNASEKPLGLGALVARTV